MIAGNVHGIPPSYTIVWYLNIKPLPYSNMLSAAVTNLYTAVKTTVILLDICIPIPRGSDQQSKNRLFQMLENLRELPSFS